MDGGVPIERRQPSRALDTLDSVTIRRYRDLHFEVMAVKLLPGEHYVTSTPGEMIVTVLGSCVAACIRDPAIGIGGMNHFMLPESGDGRWGAASATLRYGNFAMEMLINDILKLGGCRGRLEVKLFGGASLMGTSAIGIANGEFALRYLKAEGLAVAAQDLFGLYPRRLHYFPCNGQAHVLALRRQADLAMVAAEERYRDELERASAAGSIELFDGGGPS